MKTNSIAKRMEVFFADEKLKKYFEDLAQGTSEEKQLREFISRALDDIFENPRRYIQIQRNRWPKVYVRNYHIKNLWKYDLPNGWRLIYTIRENEVDILAIILEWFPHKEYDKKFGY